VHDPRDIPGTMDLDARHDAFSEEPFGVMPLDKQRLFEIDNSGVGTRSRCASHRWLSHAGKRWLCASATRSVSPALTG